MNNNSSKQLVLSIVGIAVLAIAVVGVSFAFFTYSRTGTSNNVITTGSINFSFEEENSLELVNKFPQEDADGKNNDKLNFKVFGSISNGGVDIAYDVYAIAGDVVYTDANGNIVASSATGAKARQRMVDDHIKVYVTGSTTATGDTLTVASPYDVGGVAGNSANGFKIASGVIKADGTTHTHNYTLTMWVNSTVTISDTEAATYRASAVTADTPAEEKVNTNPVYSEQYYSLKIKVEASA